MGVLKKKEFNFYLRYMEKTKTDDHSLQKYGWLVWLLLLVFVIVGIYSFLQVQILNRQIELDEITQYIENAAVIEQYENVMALEKARDRAASEMQYLNGVRASYAVDPLIDAQLFTQISASMGGDFIIESYQYTRDTRLLSLVISTSAADALPQAVQRLRATALFDDVQYSGYTSAGEGNYQGTVGCLVKASAIESGFVEVPEMGENANETETGMK